MTDIVRWRARSLAMALILTACGQAAEAQQQPAPAPAPAAPPQPAAPQFVQSPEWSKLPKMVLERQFSGPLQDTVIQRLRDPVDGTICYLYLPISVPHTPTTASGFVQYGPNVIGSINCGPPAAPLRSPAPAAARKP